METKAFNTLRGGEFLTKETQSETSFIPEEFGEESLMMADACQDFIENEVLTILDKIDNQEEGLMSSLMDKAGALGLLGTAIPEEYDGFGKDFNTNLLLSEKQGGGHSFAVAISAHTCIGTLPILYFGTPKQLKKYLPKLASGEWKAAYCLTEPGSGSDALNAKTKAILSADGSAWVLNGQKMWITNAGFAHVFIVFAKVDGDKFTGFIVERDAKGLSFGEEEHKMGIKGSSTRQLFFSDCEIPKENVLGEIGKGHKIAFNILNMGRIKLAAAALGAAKRTSTGSIKYALERSQFNTKIAHFGAIKSKMAEQAIRIFALETALYRVGKSISVAHEKLMQDGKAYAIAHMEAVEEYAVEASILKVFGSETLDYCADEGVQIYGGYGYSADYMMDRCYRDSRINRIFEGTNEINRMLIVDMLIKRAMKGIIDLFGPAKAVQKELMSIPEFGNESNELFEQVAKSIAGTKKAVLMIAGMAAQKFKEALAQEQEILMNIADMVIDVFVAESLLLRAVKLQAAKNDKALVVNEILKSFCGQAVDRIMLNGKTAVSSMSSGDELRMLNMGLKRFCKFTPFNIKESKRFIADALIKEERYFL